MEDAASRDHTLHHATHPTMNVAGFLALYDRDPVKGYAWMSQNRLFLFFVYGFRSHVYENMVLMVEKNHVYGLSTEASKAISQLAEKLKNLQ
jgi:hypothetical protein